MHQSTTDNIKLRLLEQKLKNELAPRNVNVLETIKNLPQDSYLYVYADGKLQKTSATEFWAKWAIGPEGAFPIIINPETGNWVVNGIDSGVSATGPQGIQGEKGDTGAAFTYDMFTEEQLSSLKGEKGETGTGLNLKVNAEACTEIGDAYIVTSEEDPNGELHHIIFVVSVDPISFADGGCLKGDKGEAGTPSVIKIGDILYGNEEGIITLPQFLTEHQSLENYYSKDETNLKVAFEVEKATNDLKDEIEAKGYLTEHQDLTDYALKSELFSGSYTDLTNTPEIPSIEGLASETYVNEKIAEIVFPETDLSNYYTKAETYTREEVNALLPEVKQEVISTVVPEVDAVKTTVHSVLLPKVEQEIEPTVSELKAWVEKKDYLQDIDLNGYATETWVEGKNYLTEHQSLDHKADKEHSHEQYLVAADIENKVNRTELENYYTKAQADSEFMTEAEVDARIDKVITDAVDGNTLTSLTSLVNYLNTHGQEALKMSEAITGLENKKADKSELTNYYNKTEIEGLLNTIELTPGPKGDKGDTGETGAKGEKGDQGNTPLIRILNDIWEISYDNGLTFNSTGIKAVGAKGEDGKDGKEGVGISDIIHDRNDVNGNCIYRIILTDGRTEEFTVYRGEKGDAGKDGAQGPKGDTGPVGPQGIQGKDGKDFTYDMFTEEQLAALKGDPFTFEDFTPEQLESLRGPQGEPGTGGASTVVDEKSYSLSDLTGSTWLRVAKLTDIEAKSKGIITIDTSADKRHSTIVPFDLKAASTLKADNKYNFKLKMSLLDYIEKIESEGINIKLTDDYTLLAVSPSLEEDFLGTYNYIVNNKVIAEKESKNFWINLDADKTITEYVSFGWGAGGNLSDLIRWNLDQNSKLNLDSSAEAHCVFYFERDYEEEGSSAILYLNGEQVFTPEEPYEGVYTYEFTAPLNELVNYYIETIGDNVSCAIEIISEADLSEKTVSFTNIELLLEEDLENVQFTSNTPVEVIDATETSYSYLTEDLTYSKFDLYCSLTKNKDFITTVTPIIQAPELGNSYVSTGSGINYIGSWPEPTTNDAEENINVEITEDLEEGEYTGSDNSEIPVALSDIFSGDDIEIPVGSSAGSSGSTSFGITAIQFERYDTDIYVCALLNYPSTNHLRNFYANIFIENSTNLELLEKLELVNLDDVDSRGESQLLEGTTFKANTDYNFKVRGNLGALYQGLISEDPLYPLNFTINDKVIFSYYQERDEYGNLSWYYSEGETHNSTDFNYFAPFYDLLNATSIISSSSEFNLLDAINWDIHNYNGKLRLTKVAGKLKIKAECPVEITVNQLPTEVTYFEENSLTETYIKDIDIETAAVKITPVGYTPYIEVYFEVDFPNTEYEFDFVRRFVEDITVDSYTIENNEVYNWSVKHVELVYHYRSPYYDLYNPYNRIESLSQILSNLSSSIGSYSSSINDAINEIRQKIVNGEFGGGSGSSLTEEEILEILDSYSTQVEELDIGTSETLDITSDTQIPTSKAMAEYISNNSNGSSSSSTTSFILKKSDIDAYDNEYLGIIYLLGSSGKLPVTNEAEFSNELIIQNNEGITIKTLVVRWQTNSNQQYYIQIFDLTSEKGSVFSRSIPMSDGESWRYGAGWGNMTPGTIPYVGQRLHYVLNTYNTYSNLYPTIEDFIEIHMSHAYYPRGIGPIIFEFSYDTHYLVSCDNGSNFTAINLLTQDKYKTTDRTITIDKFFTDTYKVATSTSTIDVSNFVTKTEIQNYINNYMQENFENGDEGSY